MSSKHDLIRISEFAKACKVTRQTIYVYVRQLEAEKSNIDDYIKIVEDVKMLTKLAQDTIIEKLGIAPDKIEQNLSKLKDEKVKNASKKVLQDDNMELLKKQISTLEQQLEVLSNQLNVKDMQIAEKDKQINSLTNILNSNTKALEDIVKTNREGQYLEYLDKAPIKEDAPKEETDTQKKESFFSRLFKNFR